MEKILVTPRSVTAGGHPSLAKLNDAAGKLNAIITEIREGQGTLGLLIADPSLWERLQRILGGVEESRTLKFLIEHSGK